MSESQNKSMVLTYISCLHDIQCIYHMNSDALESTYYIDRREYHYQRYLSTNAPQISNVLKNLKTVAITKWRGTEIFVPGVIHSGALDSGYPLVMMF